MSCARMVSDTAYMLARLESQFEEPVGLSSRTITNREASSIWLLATCGTLHGPGCAQDIVGVWLMAMLCTETHLIQAGSNHEHLQQNGVTTLGQLGQPYSCNCNTRWHRTIAQAVPRVDGGTRAGWPSAAQPSQHAPLLVNLAAGCSGSTSNKMPEQEWERDAADRLD